LSKDEADRFRDGPVGLFEQLDGFAKLLDVLCCFCWFWLGLLLLGSGLLFRRLSSFGKVDVAL
jgi:hypothetical protein